jgi:hypothetical protein
LLPHRRGSAPSLIGTAVHRAALWWRASGYAAAVAPLVFVVGVAWLCPDFNRTELPDWKSVYALANASLREGDLYDARRLFLQVERIAAWRGDWEGLVAAACGIHRLAGERGPYSQSLQILLRALSAAQIRQSREGVAAVANAFTLLGEHNAAAMSLAQIRKEWPRPIESAGDTLVENCRAGG